MSHRCRNPLFGLAFKRNIIFFRDTARPFAEQLRFDHLQEADKCAEDGDALIHTQTQQLQIKRLGLFFFFPRDYYQQLWRNCRFSQMSSPSLFLSGSHFSCVHLNSNRVPTYDFSLKSKYSVVSDVHCYLHSIYIYRKLSANMPYCWFLLAWSNSTVQHQQLKQFIFWSLFWEVGGSC